MKNDPKLNPMKTVDRNSPMASFKDITNEIYQNVNS